MRDSSTTPDAVTLCNSAREYQSERFSKSGVKFVTTNMETGIARSQEQDARIRKTGPSHRSEQFHAANCCD